MYEIDFKTKRHASQKWSKQNVQHRTIWSFHISVYLVYLLQNLFPCYITTCNTKLKIVATLHTLYKIE